MPILCDICKPVLSISQSFRWEDPPSPPTSFHSQSYPTNFREYNHRTRHKGYLDWMFLGFRRPQKDAECYSFFFFFFLSPVGKIAAGSGMQVMVSNHCLTPQNFSLQSTIWFQLNNQTQEFRIRERSIYSNKVLILLSFHSPQKFKKKNQFPATLFKVAIDKAWLKSQVQSRRQKTVGVNSSSYLLGNWANC